MLGGVVLVGFFLFFFFFFKFFSCWVGFPIRVHAGSISMLLGCPGLSKSTGAHGFESQLQILVCLSM